jgi:hypothetical protein
MNDKTPDILIGPLLLKLKDPSLERFGFDEAEVDYLIRLVEEDIDD